VLDLIDFERFIGLAPTEDGDFQGIWHGSIQELQKVV
jgi:hypothetical protein